MLNICVVIWDVWPLKGQATGPFLMFSFRFSLHPVLCVVRSADESPDVLLLQMTEIEIQNNHTEEYLGCLPNTLLKNMLFYGSNAFYKAPCEGGGVEKAGRSRGLDVQRAPLSTEATTALTLLQCICSALPCNLSYKERWGQNLECKRPLFLNCALV